jgi:hypothetical protein
MDMGKLDMVSKDDLSLHCLKQWQEILQEPKKDLGGHNQLDVQGIQERWRAMETVYDGCVQQKSTGVLGAYALRRYWKLEALCQECMHN